MSDLERAPGVGPASLGMSRGPRAVARNRAWAQAMVSAADAQTDVTIAEIEDLSMATGAGMRAVLQVTQVQEAMERIAPAAAGRLAQLADEHCLGVSELLSDLRRNLRRI